MIYKKSWIYILIKDTLGLGVNHEFFRPKAIKNFFNVKKGDIGGYVDGYHNLSQKGDCWIYDYAWVYRNARVSGNAKVKGKAQVFGNAQITDNARIFNHVRISGDAIIGGNMVVSGGRIITGGVFT